MTTQEPSDCPIRKQPPTPSRRDFIMASATSAGLLLAGTAAAQAPPSAPPPESAPANVSDIHSGEDVNVAIIGLGGEGMVLIESLLRIPGVRIRAGCDIWEYSRKRAAGTLKKFGHPIAAYENFHDLLDKENDLHAAFVATPDSFHAEHAIACMNAGLHVYCESPISNSLQDARRIIAAARETGRILQIGHQRRSNPRYIHAIDVLIKQYNLLGGLTHAYAQWNRGKYDDLVWPKKYEIPMETLNRYGYASMDQFRNWRWYERFGGGPLLSCGSHQIDVMNWAFESMPTHVYATGGADIYPQHECIDTALCTLEYELPGGKARTHYEVLSSSSLGGYFEKLTGPEGTLVISEFPPRGNFAVRENVAPEWEPFAQKGLLTLPVERPFQTPKGVVVVVSVSPDSGVLGWSIPVKMEEPLHLPHVRNFIDAIRKGHCVACSGETAYRALVVIARIRQSIEKQQRLRFSPREFVV